MQEQFENLNLSEDDIQKFKSDANTGGRMDRKIDMFHPCAGAIWERRDGLGFDVENLDQVAKNLLSGDNGTKETHP